MKVIKKKKTKILNKSKIVKVDEFEFYPRGAKDF